MKKLTVSLVTILVAGLLFTSCTKNLSGFEDDIIEIGYVQSPASLPLFVAQEKGFFEEQGVKVKLKLYSEQSTLSSAYLEGKIPGRANLTVTSVNESLSGLDHKIVLVQNFSNGTDVIIGNSSITSLEDLQGKKVGVGYGILEEFLLEWSLISRNMTLDDVQIVNGNQETLLEKMRNQEIDALITHDPFATTLLQNNDQLNEIYSTKDAPALFINVLTFNQEFIDNNEKEVQKIVNAYFDAVKLLEENPQEAFIEGITYLHQKQQSVENDAQEGIFLNLRENNEVMNPDSQISLMSNLKTVYSFLNGEKPDEETIQNLVDDRFVENLFFNSSIDVEK